MSGVCCRICGAEDAATVYMVGEHRRSLGNLCEACERRLFTVAQQVVRLSPTPLTATRPAAAPEREEQGPVRPTVREVGRA